MAEFEDLLRIKMNKFAKRIVGRPLRGLAEVQAIINKDIAMLNLTQLCLRWLYHNPINSNRCQ